jgi:hypothetical protein
MDIVDACREIAPTNRQADAVSARITDATGVVSRSWADELGKASAKKE